MQSELDRGVPLHPTHRESVRGTLCTPEQSVARTAPLPVAYPVPIQSLKLGTARRHIGRNDHSFARGYGVHLSTG
jgi:hypothetical protein